MDEDHLLQRFAFHCRGCCLGEWSSDDTMTGYELDKLSRNGDTVFGVWVQFLYEDSIQAADFLTFFL